MCGCNGLISNCDDCARSISVLAGAAGASGINGDTVVTGTGAPSDSSAANQIMYVDRNSPFNVYFRVSGAWILYGQLKGTDGNGFLVRQTTTCSQSDISTLSSVGKEIVPPLPTTYYASVIEAVGVMKAGSVAYSIGAGQLHLKYTTNGDSALYWDNTLLGTQANTTRIERSRLVQTSVEIPAGSGLTLKQNFANPVLGNGTLDIHIVYHIQIV